MRNVQANEKARLKPQEDYVYAKVKCKAIIDRFLDSDVAPKNQVIYVQCIQYVQLNLQYNLRNNITKFCKKSYKIAADVTIV